MVEKNQQGKPYHLFRRKRYYHRLFASRALRLIYTLFSIVEPARELNTLKPVKIILNFTGFFILNKIVVIAGKFKTHDGKIFTFSFEQITPEGSTTTNIRQSLNHARDKKANIALVYMKHNNHTKQTVVEGIKEYENRNGYRFKQIIVVTLDGRIH